MYNEADLFGVIGCALLGGAIFGLAIALLITDNQIHGLRATIERLRDTSERWRQTAETMKERAGLYRDMAHDWKRRAEEKV